MESNGDSKSGLFTAGGVLSIIGGIPQIISGGGFIAIFLMPRNLIALRCMSYMRQLLLPFFMPFLPYDWRSYILKGKLLVESHWPILGGCLVVLGIVAVIGGISAIRRKRFGLSLAGAICALPLTIEGILAVIFIAVSKKKFE